MTTSVIPFAFDALTVRAIILADGNPWFVAQDVCEALEHSDTSMAVRRLDADEKGTSIVCTHSGEQEMLVISESGLYSLVLTSRKPEAKRFKKWITSEVLPSIRKTGSYSIQQHQALPNFANPAEAARAWALEFEAKQIAVSERDRAIATKAEIGTRREATAMATASVAARKVEKLQVELDESKQWASVKRMEMAYHGQKFNWRLVKAASAELGLPIEQAFDVNYGTVNTYHAEAWRAAYAVDIL